MRIFCLSELCKKEVICIDDGRKLGYPSDIRFDAKSGKLIELIVPCKSSLSFFGSRNCVKIPWCDVERVGEDVIWICGENYRGDKFDRDNKRDDCCCN